MVPMLITYLVPAIHVIACAFLIVVVLLQTGKGADMGAVFGGGSQTLFGSTGAGNLLTKVTTGLAITFMLTSLIMTGWQSRGVTSGLLDKLPPPAAEAPVVPPIAPAPGADAPVVPDVDATAPPAAEPQAAAPGDAPATAGGEVDAPATEPAARP